MKVSDARSCVNLLRFLVNFVIKNLFKAAVFVGSPLIICQQRHFRFVWMSFTRGRSLCAPYIRRSTQAEHTKPLKPRRHLLLFIYGASFMLSFMWSTFFICATVSSLCRNDTWNSQIIFFLHSSHLLLLLVCFSPSGHLWYARCMLLE